MNERIRELVRQAVVAVDIVTGNESLDNELAKMYIPDCFSEKFAELIVEECIDIAKNWEDQLENADSLSESNAVGIVAYRIARQFGVKQ